MIACAFPAYAWESDLTEITVYEEINQEALYASVADSGTCGANLTWVLDSDGTLTISGTGPMEDYTTGMLAKPWGKYHGGPPACERTQY